MRLLRTTVSLIGPSTSTTCGTVSTLTAGGKDVSAQTYSVACPPTEEMTVAVLLSDDQTTTAEKRANALIMNIAEVMVYVQSSKCGLLDGNYGHGCFGTNAIKHLQ